MPAAIELRGVDHGGCPVGRNARVVSGVIPRMRFIPRIAMLFSHE